MDTTAPIYLDYAATTPLDPAVIAAMTECLAQEGGRGNPASLHGWGRRASARIETARAEVAALIGAAAEQIVFTSGATESDNLAVLGVARAAADRGRHLVSTRIEHKAALDPCRRLQKEGFAVTLLAPDRTGRIDPQALAAALRPETTLVSVMWVNNETGVIQDVEAIGALCRERGILFHTDAAQAVGKVAMAVRELPIDLMSFTAHKFYGPKGIGALYVRAGVRAQLQPLLYGGGQERGLRPGTLPTHQIVGFGAACALARGLLGHEPLRIAALRDRLWGQLEPLGGIHLNGAGAPRVAGILNVSIEGVEGESLVAGLPDLAVSTGSACNSASGEPSYVLRALGRDTELAQSSLRFSLGRFSHEADIDAAAAAVRREVTRLRTLSPAEEPPAVSGAQLLGEAGGPGREVWIRFWLGVEAGRVRDAAYRVYGCPHTMAAAAWLAEQVRGRAVGDLVPGMPQEWAQALGIPAEKLGRLLTLEDALRECQRRGSPV
jgi:cysteine desulfurase